MSATDVGTLQGSTWTSSDERDPTLIILDDGTSIITGFIKDPVQKKLSPLSPKSYYYVVSSISSITSGC